MHKFFYEQRKAFSFRKLTIGLVSLCVGTSLLFGIQSQEVSASTVSPSQIRFEYVLEAELSAEERQLIQSSLPAELKEEATYFVVYRPSKKVLPATGELAGSGLAVLGLGFLVLAVSATKSKKARVLTMLYVTTSGLALPVLEVGAVQSSALAAYNQTLTIRPGDSLPDGKLRLDGYEFVGYFIEEKSEVKSQARDEKTSLSTSNQLEESKTSPETAEVDKQISTGEVSGKPDQASQPIVEQADKTEQTGKAEESQDQAAQPTEAAVEEKLITTIPTEAPSHLLPTIDFQVQDKVEEIALEIPEEQIETNQLPLGQSRVEEGQAGSLRISYQEVLVDGQVIARKEISREEIPSTPRKVYIGTGQVVEGEVTETDSPEEPVQPTEAAVEEKLITTIPTEAPIHHLPTIDFQVQDKVEEIALEIPEEQIETDELAIGQSRVEEGQAGSLRISYQEVLVAGQIVARNEISREEIPSTPKRTYIGTRRDEKYVAPATIELPTATIRTQEEEITFERKEVLRADWPLGKVEVVAGKKGKQLHTYAVIEGVETLLKTEVLEQAEAEITYKGVNRPETTTEEIVIDFTERVISDPEQYTDYRQIEVTGEQGLKRLHKENGQLVNEEIVKPAKEQVVRVGTKPIEGQVEKESLRTIDFVRRYESNDQLEYGQTRTKRPGQSGQEKVISTYQTIKGVEGKFLSSRTELIKQVQDEIIEVGTKPQIRIEQEEPVIEYVPEPAKERNVQTVLQEGHAKETTYRTVYNLDTNSGQVMPIQLPGTVSHPGQVRRISVGTKPTITKKALPFTEETIPNSTLYVGERVIVRPGRAGEEITTVHYTLNPRTGETSASQPLIQVIAAVTQVVQVGTKAVDRTVETVDSRAIEFKTEYRADSTLPYPQREVLQEGSNGVERITTTRRYVRDQEVGEPTRVNEVVKVAQNRIIKVGTQPVERTEQVILQEIRRQNAELAKGTENVIHVGSPTIRVYRTNYSVNPTTGQITTHPEVLVSETAGRAREVEIGTKEPEQPVTPPTENEESCPIIPDNSDGGTCEAPTDPTEKPSSPDLECILNPTDQCWPEEPEEVNQETVAQLRAKMEKLMSYRSRFRNPSWHTYIDAVYNESEKIIQSGVAADIRTQLDVIDDDLDFVIEAQIPKISTDANSGASRAENIELITDANGGTAPRYEDNPTPVTPNPDQGSGTEKPVETPIPPVSPITPIPEPEQPRPTVPDAQPVVPDTPPVTPKPNPEQPTVPDTPDTTETETPIDVDIDSLPKPTMFIRKVDIQKDARKAIIHYILEDSAERFEGGQAHLFVNDKIVSTVPIRRQNGKVQAEFTDLKPNVDYLVRTELTYSGTSESLVDSLADEASIEIEERQLQIKHIDRIELWKFENGKASIQRELATKPVNLTNYFAKVISNQQKEILLPISQVDLQSENGESFYLIKASLDNLVEEQSTSNSYSPGLTFRVAKQKTSTSTGTYTDFASLVRAMQERPSDTFVLGADLTASSVDLAGKDSYITNQFYGRLNGAGYTIYDLQAPLFHKTSGQIENLNLKDVAIYQKGKNEVGALAKEAGGGRIEKISVDGVVVGGNHVGGLLGSILNTRVTNITVRGRISSQSTDLSSNYLGGLAGWVGTGGQVQGVYADVILSTNSSRAKVGGIVGQMENTGSYIKKAYAQGMISAQKNIDSEAGGIVGMIAGTADSIIDDVISAVSVPNGGKVYQYVSDPAIQVKKIYVVDNEASGQDRNGQEILTVEEAKERLASYQIVEPIPAVPTVRQQHPQYNVDYSLHPHYQENRKLAYDNMEKLLPFFTKDVIVQQANRLSKDDPLVTKKLLDVIAIDGHNNDRPVFDTNGQRNYINKVMFHFEDGSIEYEWLVKKQDINSGVITEYFVVDREITYTPENLVQATNLNRLVDRLLPEFTGLEYRSQEVLSALGLTGYGNDFAIQELLFLNESFAKVKTNIRHYLRDILVSDRAISLTSETIENYIFDYIKNNKAQLLLGLAYMDRWYSIRYGDLNAQEWMIKKPDFFGNPVSSLDQLIMIGGLGAGALKPNNNYALGSQLVAKPAIKGNLFDYLEAYRKRFAPNQTDSDWFKSATKANIIETNSTVEEVRVKQEDTSNKKYSNRFYDKLKSDTWRFKEMALILLTMPSRDIFILTDMANTVIGSYDNQHGTPEQIEKAIEKTAKDWAGHADYLYRILPKEHKEKMFRQVVTWDTKMINRTWYEIDSLSSRSKNSFKYFYMPLGYSYPVGTGASAQSDLRDIFYFNADVNSQEGNRVYTHELTHVAEDDTYLLGHGRRSGTGHEIYARGLFETLTWFNQDLLGINSIFDFSNYEQASYGRRLTNLNPERFQSTQDFEKYMRGYMDVIYTLDYLEAEAVLKLSGTNNFNTAHRNWFNQMTTNANDETQIDKFNRATKFTSVEDFIDNGMVSRRSYDPPGHIVRETFPHDSYLSVNALNPIYGALNNDGVSRNEFEFRKIAFELLAEKGYENGFVPYLSNQYQSELGQIDSAGRIPDNQLISKISGGEFTNSAQFRKAMFNRRKDNLSQLKAVKIYGKRDGEGYFYDTTRTLHSIDELRQLMKEAVEYDANHLLYASQKPYASSTNSYNKTQSRVYSLKAAVLNGYLRATNDFRESIYVTNP
ncbi:ZmpA/ZmpB/ZmpC family metallo-endopeptidase [Streptococcus suis]|uniref:ZmpA/ZmpB/ZmpC family metallo-endopeptidase n=1 Tax=Streptococcus suis TaxID=1307 RepID=UPI00040EC63C|nr:ZmpA/ZmpB/ZmpC family metallo-endopeptidase [Streptococcus suis]